MTWTTNMNDGETYPVRPIGFVKTALVERKNAPRQPNEGAPEAWIEIAPEFLEALDGIAVGDQVIVLTWLHLASRETLKVHPRHEMSAPLKGVFATRSPDRPNPVGLHQVTVLEVDPKRGIRVDALEAVDGTPAVDLKPVWC